MPKRDEPEFRLHCLIADMLRLHAKPGVLAFHPPNGEHRSPRTGARLKRMLTVRGIPDFVILKIGTPTIGLELKAEGAYQSAEQRAVETAWTLAGGVYFLAKGFRAAADFLEMMEVINPVRDSVRFAPRAAA